MMDPTTGPVMSCDESEVDSLDSEVEEVSEGLASASVEVKVTTDPDTSAVSVGGRGATVNV